MHASQAKVGKRVIVLSGMFKGEEGTIAQVPNSYRHLTTTGDQVWVVFDNFKQNPRLGPQWFELVNLGLIVS